MAHQHPMTGPPAVGDIVKAKGRRGAAREVIGVTETSIELMGLSGNQRNSTVRRDRFAAAYEIQSRARPETTDAHRRNTP